jgi:hypothetical protein
MTARNDITGDSIANNKGDSKKYADNWEKIFGKKKETAYIEDIANNQEELGTEFEEALANNLDKLYDDNETDD